MPPSFSLMSGSGDAERSRSCGRSSMLNTEKSHCTAKYLRFARKCIQVVVDSTFLEAAVQLLDEKTYACERVLGERTGEMESIAFYWAMQVDQIQTRSDMKQFCGNIQNAVPRIIGALARGRLEAISALLFKEISAKKDINVRPQLLSLCNAMKYVRLSYASDDLFGASLNLIQHADPLKHSPQIKKSQVRHALSSMMHHWLSPLVESASVDLAHISVGLQELWYGQIDDMQEGLRIWAEEKTKHYIDGFPLVVDLWCLQKNSSFIERGDKIFKMLKKALKMKEEYRCLAVRCLLQCCRVALHRLGASTQASEKLRLEDWLEKALSEITLSLKKGPTPSPDLHDLVIRLCVTLGRRRPVLVAESVILPILLHEQWDKVTIVLRSMLELMFTAIAQSASQATTNCAKGLRRMTVSLEANILEPQLLAYIRNGDNALSLLSLGDRHHQFSREIGKRLKMLEGPHGLHGAQTPNHRSGMSEVAKDMTTGLNVLAWTLRIIPYVLPEELSLDRLVGSLKEYTGHSDALIRHVAFRSLKNVMNGMPRTRNAIVHCLADRALAIPDDDHQGILDGLRNLHIVLMDWLVLARSSPDESTSSGSQLRTATLEGKVFCFLCCVEPSIRRLVFDILATIRRLDSALAKPLEQVETQPIPEQSAMPPVPSDDSNFVGVGHPARMNVYLRDVLEEMGSDIAHRVYWDLGPWSDLHRRWRLVPENICLTDVLFAPLDGHKAAMRLARFLSEITVEAFSLRPRAFEEAYIQISTKIWVLFKSEISNRMTSTIDLTEQISIELFRNYCCFAAACPPFNMTGYTVSTVHTYRLSVVAEFVGRGMTVNALHRRMLNLLSTGTVAHQEVAVTALGHCNPEAYEILARELQQTMTNEQVKDRSRSKQTNKSRMEEMRFNTAKVFRIIADKMPRGTLKFRKSLRQRLLEFIDHTLYFIRQLSRGSLFESIAQPSAELNAIDVLYLSYCLCSVAANAGPEIIATPGQEGLNVERRRVFFGTMQQWNAAGVDSSLSNWDYSDRKRHMRAAVVIRFKDVESTDRLESELEEHCRFLEVASCLAMVSMLQGPPWDTDRRSNNPIFTWIDYLLVHAEPHGRIGPSNISIARQALTKLIISNMELFNAYVNKCYYKDQTASAVYFQVVCEVYCSYEVKIDVHVILSLVLYKCVDVNPQVRADALHLLKCLSHREWGGKCTTGWAMWSNGNSIEDDVIVSGSLQDTCQSFQYQLSESLAREHPEVNEELCEELMTMQCNDMVNPGLLLCLMPWMEQLSFSHGDSKWGDRLLKSMYYVTSQHGKEFSHEVERLWSTIASKGNIRPILTFLVEFAVNECAVQDAEVLLQYHSVMKRISLYVSRASPHRTIDHLVSEAARMMQIPAVITVEGESVQTSTPLKFSSRTFLVAVHKRRDSTSSQLEAMRSIETSAGSTRTRPRSFTNTPMHHRERTYASNVSVSMQSDGSYEEAFKTDGLLVQNSKTSMSNLSALGGDRRGSEVTVPVLKGLLQRADVAICMLAEIAFEQGDEFSDHVPLLFHMCVICMDSLETVVRLHCQQLVINLLNVLLSKRVGVPSKANKLSALVSALQSMKGQAPWPYEDTNLAEGQVLSEGPVRFFVAGLLEATGDGSNLKDLWIKEALTWAVESASRHLSCRSFQVLRSLSPTATSEAFIKLVLCLRSCFLHPSVTAMECVLEILETMKMLMLNAEESKLVLYPQLFWVCISLLGSDYVHVYCLALELLHCLLDSIKISNDMILNVLLATTPTSIRYSPVVSSAMGVIHEEASANKEELKELQTWDLGSQILLPGANGKENPVLCIQQLLIKGLCLSQTEDVTVRLMSLLSLELVMTPEVTLDSSSYLDDLRPKTGEHSGVAVLLGSVQVQIAVSLASVLPWICQKILSGGGLEGPWELCNALAEACISERYSTVASSLMDVPSAESACLLLVLTRLADAMCDELPSQMLSLIIGYWLGFLKSREHGSAQIGFLLLRSIFDRCKNPSFSLPALRVVSDFSNFALISSHLQGSNAVEAAEVLSAIVACASMSHSPQEQPIDPEHWSVLSRALDLGTSLHQLVPSDNEHIKNTINGVLETCPPHLRRPSGKDCMPFLKEHEDR